MRNVPFSAKGVFPGPPARTHIQRWFCQRAILFCVAGFTTLTDVFAESAFTYQGRLADGGVPANGNFDFQFRLYDAGAGGNQISSTLTNSGNSVTGGLFTVSLGFGDDAF